MFRLCNRSSKAANANPKQSHSIKEVKRRAIRGLMKCLSVNESLHRIYGSDSEGKSEKKTETVVTFTTIEIREYGRTIGDNPSCSSGPPVSISWDYAPSITLPVEDYEDNRPPRRSNIEMVLPRDLRQRTLRKEWDVTQNQIAAAVRTNIKIKNQRRTTINNLGKSTKIEEAFDRARRYLRSGNRRSRSTKLLKGQTELGGYERKHGNGSSQTLEQPEPTGANGTQDDEDDAADNDDDGNQEVAFALIDETTEQEVDGESMGSR